MRFAKISSVEEKESDKESQMMEIAKKGMGSSETEFAEEENLGEQKLTWSKKYAPQKPKYFNRVQRGYEWNRYNRTHFDEDNPPPSVVQGYRFNIFYPDLVDVTNTPKFDLYEYENDPDFAMIVFSGGPPYENIAFKIENKEWDTDHKHGYKCQFEHGVLQLWFSFKRVRYRR